MYWWQVIIPQQRTKLAISKSRGEVKEYLEDLNSSSNNNDDNNNSNNNRALEKWLFADWLRKTKNKPAALPFLKKAKWNSGDNPILVAFAGISSLVIAASIAERVVTVTNN